MNSGLPIIHDQLYAHDYLRRCDAKFQIVNNLLNNYDLTSLKEVSTDGRVFTQITALFV